MFLVLEVDDDITGLGVRLIRNVFKGLLDVKLGMRANCNRVGLSPGFLLRCPDYGPGARQNGPDGGLPNAGELAQLGTHVLLLDYRGYGLSEGEPEESGVYADARAGLAYLGHKEGDFPVTDRHAREIITFPADQHLSREQQDYVIETVRDFYASH